MRALVRVRARGMTEGLVGIMGRFRVRVRVRPGQDYGSVRYRVRVIMGQFRRRLRRMQT